jgi:hypothetical protein
MWVDGKYDYGGGWCVCIECVFEGLFMGVYVN